MRIMYSAYGSQVNMQLEVLEISALMFDMRSKDAGRTLRTIREILHMLPLDLRLWRHINEEAAKGTFDKDGDGMIENEEFPDQTYDAWTVSGVSTYSGGLWVAAVQAASAMAREAVMLQLLITYGLRFRRQSLYMTSYGYARASGLSPIADEEKISAVKKIYDFNVLKHKGGMRGAVNGMLPNGKADMSALHISNCEWDIPNSLPIVWSDKGLGFGFQTPEGWNTYDHYRSLCYMRPLAIWAMQWALTKPKLHSQEMNHISATENSLYVKHHAGSQEVARLLKLPKEEASKSYMHEGVIASKLIQPPIKTMHFIIKFVSINILDINMEGEGKIVSVLISFSMTPFDSD
ncbi:hypothetical protein RND71_028361 [Anisodus tanguticus]|uniref:Glycosyl-hydrolase family 116 catalytic region domain-containing protein n=1 Tax=Anisodus tanguticus TaxID=243964 RepID=A0AAE1RJI6_9SOLA|nr:hypothetical protein RND71_028361 [Anisodus tanguticus]